MLLVACCGPCACVSDAFADFEVTLFLNGNNFDTEREYNRRLKAFETVAEKLYGGKKFVMPYTPRVFNSCVECIGERLRTGATCAGNGGFDCFSTTLTVSPHKNSGFINEIGRAVGKENNVPFIEFDLKKGGGYGKSTVISKELGLYRQNYCGCAKSVRS